MTATATTLWDTNFTSTSINGTFIGSGGISLTTSAAIDNNGKLGTEVSVTIQYSSPVLEPAIVSLVRLADDAPTYENGGSAITGTGVNSDVPWSILMPTYGTTDTVHKTFVVPAVKVSLFKVVILNQTGVGLTCTVKYRQFKIQVV